MILWEKTWWWPDMWGSLQRHCLFLQGRWNRRCSSFYPQWQELYPRIVFIIILILLMLPLTLSPCWLFCCCWLYLQCWNLKWSRGFGAESNWDDAHVVVHLHFDCFWGGSINHDDDDQDDRDQWRNHVLNSKTSIGLFPISQQDYRSSLWW